MQISLVQKLYEFDCICNTGDREISFQYRKDNTYAKGIKEEAYIRTNEDEFVT